MFNGYKVSLWDDKKGLELKLDRGDGCTAMCMCLTPPNCALKNVYSGKSILRVFYHNKKEIK